MIMANILCGFCDVNKNWTVTIYFFIKRREMWKHEKFILITESKTVNFVLNKYFINIWESWERLGYI